MPNDKRKKKLNENDVMKWDADIAEEYECIIYCISLMYKIYLLDILEQRKFKECEWESCVFCYVEKETKVTTKQKAFHIVYYGYFNMDVVQIALYNH